MRFEVPQFIEVEDKIFGPFTWKQFIYLAGGAGALLILYFTLPFIFFGFFAVPIAALSTFLAFHRVNNRPFSIYLESIFRYFTSTKLYLWKRQNKQIIKAEERQAPPQQNVQPPPPVAQNNINSLSRKLELNTLHPNEIDNGNQ